MGRLAVGALALKGGKYSLYCAPKSDPRIAFRGYRAHLPRRDGECPEGKPLRSALGGQYSVVRLDPPVQEGRSLVSELAK